MNQKIEITDPFTLGENDEEKKEFGHQIDFKSKQKD